MSRHRSTEPRVRGSNPLGRTRNSRRLTAALGRDLAAGKISIADVRARLRGAKTAQRAS